MSVKIRFKCKDPLWEDCFSFLVHNPRRQELEVEVIFYNSSPVSQHRSKFWGGGNAADSTDGSVFPPERR